MTEHRVGVRIRDMAGADALSVKGQLATCSKHDLIKQREELRNPTFPALLSWTEAAPQLHPAPQPSHGGGRGMGI